MSILLQDWFKNIISVLFKMVWENWKIVHQIPIHVGKLKNDLCSLSELRFEERQRRKSTCVSSLLSRPQGENGELNWLMSILLKRWRKRGVSAKRDEKQAAFC